MPELAMDGKAGKYHSWDEKSEEEGKASQHPWRILGRLLRIRQ